MTGPRGNGGRTGNRRDACASGSERQHGHSGRLQECCSAGFGLPVRAGGPRLGYSHAHLLLREQPGEESAGRASAGGAGGKEWGRQASRLEVALGRRAARGRGCGGTTSCAARGRGRRWAPAATGGRAGPSQPAARERSALARPARRGPVETASHERLFDFAIGQVIHESNREGTHLLKRAPILTLVSGNSTPKPFRSVFFFRPQALR